ncbi:MAG: endolytic transglycosylase MltG [Saprospiraceae bacterium]
MSFKKSTSYLLGLLLLGTVLFGAYKINKVAFAANVPNSIPDEFICIPSNATYDQIVQQLVAKGYIENEASFRTVAEWMHFEQPNMRAGRYKIEKEWGNYTLINKLKTGKQSPVKVVLHDARLVEDIASRVGKLIEPDSVALMTAFSDSALLAKFGLNKENFMSIFIPNTYEVFWNITPEKFMERMKKERDNFWEKDDRLNKAKAMGLTPEQVYTFASIVEKETLKNDEKPRIAGLYLNRYHIDMPLQADPTAVFATRDFDATRVLDYHLQYDSPYNTYKYKGLPPGPIYMASISSIDAVLEAEKHNYIFMCAKPDESGYHAFAETMQGHRVNANAYRDWLDKRGY